MEMFQLATLLIHLLLPIVYTHSQTKITRLLYNVARPFKATLLCVRIL